MAKNKVKNEYGVEGSKFTKEKVIALILDAQRNESRLQGFMQQHENNELADVVKTKPLASWEKDITRAIGQLKGFLMGQLPTEYKLFDEARKGVPTKLFYSLAKQFKMSEKALADILNVSSRTISNYRDKNKSLDPVQAEHLLKLNALYKKGQEIFGSVEEFNYWLKKPFWKNDETPYSWLITPGGVDLVDQELERLAQGYPA